ncbi:hypothetical protein ACO0QE_003477 [Hanseniaspora vineae]
MAPTQDVTKESLKDITTGLRTNLQAFTQKQDLHTKIETKFDKSKNENVNELEELAKLAKLIKAHTTKLGILLSKFGESTKPDQEINTVEQDLERLGTPLLTEITDLNSSVWYLLSLLHIIHANTVSSSSKDNLPKGKNCYPKIYADEVDENVLYLVQNVEELISIVQRVLTNDNNEKKTGEEISQQRLISVGKVWASCDKLVALSLSIPKVIIDYINSVTMKLLSDTLLEIEEWLEDPTLEDLDDPFGLDYSDEEGNESDNEANNGSKDAPSEKMIEFMELWNTKIRLIKLLMNSLKLSLTKATSTNNTANASGLPAKMCLHLQIIYELQKQITLKVDDLVSTVFMSSNKDFDDPMKDEDIKDLITELNENTLVRICNTVIALNSDSAKSEDTKKWIATWKLKYF